MELGGGDREGDRGPDLILDRHDGDLDSNAGAHPDHRCPRPIS
jgi:hypothetical protein